MSNETIDLAGLDEVGLRRAIDRAQQLLLWERLVEGEGPAVLAPRGGWITPEISALLAHVPTADLEMAREAVTLYARRVCALLATTDIDAALDVLRDPFPDLSGHSLDMIREERLISRDHCGLAEGGDFAVDDRRDLVRIVVSNAPEDTGAKHGRRVEDGLEAGFGHDDGAA